jgi:hypothetical protein
MIMGSIAALGSTSDEHALVDRIARSRSHMNTRSIVIQIRRRPGARSIASRNVRARAIAMRTPGARSIARRNAGARSVATQDDRPLIARVVAPAEESRA